MKTIFANCIGTERKSMIILINLFQWQKGINKVLITSLVMVIVAIVHSWQHTKQYADMKLMRTVRVHKTKVIPQSSNSPLPFMCTNFNYSVK